MNKNKPKKTTLITLKASVDEFEKVVNKYTDTLGRLQAAYGTLFGKLNEAMRQLKRTVKICGAFECYVLGNESYRNDDGDYFCEEHWHKLNQ